MADTKEIIAAGKRDGVTHCLTIPLYKETAILPNSAIAEVISYKEPMQIAEAPEWFLGYIEWRDQKIPLISFEVISGNDIQESSKDRRIAVLNTLNSNSKLPYIAMTTQGIPSLAIVQEHGLEDKETSGRDAVAGIVDLGGIEAIIPNIDEIEQRVLNLSLS